MRYGSTREDMEPGSSRECRRGIKDDVNSSFLGKRLYGVHELKLNLVAASV